MIQQMLAIWSLVPLPFLKPAWTSGSSRFTYCWSLAWRIVSFTSVWDECNCAVVWTFFGITFLWDWNDSRNSCVVQCKWCISLALHCPDQPVPTSPTHLLPSQHSGSYFPEKGWNLCFLQCKYRVLINGSPGRSPPSFVYIRIWLHWVLVAACGIFYYDMWV